MLSLPGGGKGCICCGDTALEPSGQQPAAFKYLVAPRESSCSGDIYRVTLFGCLVLGSLSSFAFVYTVLLFVRRITSAKNIFNLGEPTSRYLFRNGHRGYLRCRPAPAGGSDGLERSCSTCEERPRVCHCRLCLYWRCTVRV